MRKLMVECRENGMFGCRENMGDESIKRYDGYDGKVT